MLKKALSYLILICLFPSFYLSAQEGIILKDKADQLVNQAVTDKSCVGLAAGFSIEGSKKWSKGAGYSNKKTETLFEPGTLTRTASIAKPMTAIAIMQLFEQNKIDLDASIQTYLPDFPIKQKGTITVRQLLSHSSGIGAYQSNKERENKKEYTSLEEALKVFKDRELVAEPGKAFNYTTYGYTVLGRIIEVVSEQSYEAYLQENIWDKAGMTNTGIEQHGQVYANKAQVYHKNHKGKIKTGKCTNLSDRIPGGGIYSTTEDLLKFGDAIINNSLIQSSTLELMSKDLELKKEGNGYGLGWYLYGENPSHGNIIGHTGAQTGCSAMFMILPKSRASIIVISNTSGAMQEVSNIAVKLFEVVEKNSGKENQ